MEFVAAVAWLAELFPEPKRREKVLGYTQAFSSLGGLLVATANGLCVAYATTFPAIGGFGLGAGLADPHAPWRYTLMSGVLPAIPLILVRPFLPESPAWRQKKAAGTLGRPSIAALFSPALRRTTIVTSLMFAMVYGATFGALQQVPQIVPGLSDVRERTAAVPPAQAALINQQVAASVLKVQEMGGLAGRFLLAYLAVVIVEPPASAAAVPVSRPHRRTPGFRAGRDVQPQVDVPCDVRGGAADHRTAQLLGKLPAARVPDTPAGDGRKLRREPRRTPDRHLVRVGDVDAVDHAGSRLRADESRDGRRRRGAVRVSRRLHRLLLAAGAAEGRTAGVTVASRGPRVTS